MVNLLDGVIILEPKRKLNTKALEEYVHVKFTYTNPESAWDGWVPVEYRRTGLSIKEDDTDKLNSYLNYVYNQLNPNNYLDWLQKQDEYWKESHSNVTKPIFDFKRWKMARKRHHTTIR